MNDNLPEINFKENKKEKKKGILGWLRNRLGFGSRSAIGEAGINPSAMNVGRALGTAKFGASAGGLGSFLAGNIATIATVAAVAVAGAVYLANNAPAPSTGTSAFSSNKSSDNYVPAILRSQAANQGSSLDMFKETNKGAGLAMDEAAKAAAAKPEEPKEAAAGDEGKAQDPNQGAPDQSNMAQSMMGKLQGGSIGSLTSSMGGGSNKLSGMGGFGNKFNQGATGGKSGFSAGIGTGFQGMPKFDQRKGKMMAMKASSRPVFSSSAAGKKAKFGTGAMSQAKGMRATQKTYSGTSIDAARSTQDKAWEGSTGSGDASGGAGLSDGGAGIVTSPSLDNGSGNTGGGGTGTSDTPTIPDASSPTNVSPWAGLLQQAMMYILLAAVLAAVGGYLVKAGTAMLSNPYTAALGAMIRMIGMALCLVAIGLGLMALMAGIKVMSTHGQALLGTVYVIGGGVAIAAGAMGMTGGNAGPITPMWMAAIAGVIGLMGSMFGGK
jgi:hypothetical protein